MGLRASVNSGGCPLGASGSNDANRVAPKIAIRPLRVGRGGGLPCVAGWMVPAWQHPSAPDSFIGQYLEPSVATIEQILMTIQFSFSPNRSPHGPCGAFHAPASDFAHAKGSTQPNLTYSIWIQTILLALWHLGTWYMRSLQANLVASSP